MSDPVTNAEVEDVLSSIRRLVSDDIKPNRTPHATGTAQPEDAEDENQEPERLVLTPALRVENEPENSPAQETKEAQEDIVDAQDAGAEAIADNEAREPEDEDELAPDHADEPEVESVAFDDDEPGDAPDDPEEPSGQSVQFRAAERKAYYFLDHLRKESRSFSPTDDTEVGESHEDALDEETPTGSEPFVLADDAATAPEGEHGDTVPDQEADADPEPSVVFKRASAQELTDKIAALEKVIARTPDQWEPDGTGEDDYSGTAVETLRWEDNVDLDGSGNPIPDDQSEAGDAPIDVEVKDVETGNGDEDMTQADPVPFEHEASAESQAYEAEDNSVDVLAADEAVLDEEALRELVGDIVRQELQGGLGERITRNVRKLVRREIQRALTEQNLD